MLEHSINAKLYVVFLLFEDAIILDNLFCPRRIFSILSKSLFAFEMQCKSTYPDAGYPVAEYLVAGYPVAEYPDAGYPDAVYPTRLRPSGKCVENSTKLTCLEITGCRIKYSTVLWLLELQLRRGRNVWTGRCRK